MHTYIALFRGINVGGRNVLPMKELVAIMEELGAQAVKTWLQSGNAVFSLATADPGPYSRQLAKTIGVRRGFEPVILVLGREMLEKALAENPFPEAEAELNTLHLGFLAASPVSPDLAKLSALRRESERFHLGDGVFYLYAPEGVGRSKLAAGAEKFLGVPMTDRNWRTVCQLLDLAGR